MDNQMSPFQIALLVMFGVFTVIGMLFFSGVLGGYDAGKAVGPIQIWGTLDERAFQTVIRQLAENNDVMKQVSYVEKDPATYENDLANALASGTGPDLFLITQDAILSQKNKVVTIPYTSFPEQAFNDTFIDEAALFKGEEGILAVPLLVDPLLLYWNKDMFAQAGYAQAPKYWEQVYSMSAKLGKKDEAGTIQKSALAFGAYDNVAHAKEILITLIMQAGGEITARDGQGRIVSTLAGKSVTNTQGQPGENALRFYTNFANPALDVYTWNHALKPSMDAFARGDVAMVVGAASELPLVKAQNPNLNFGVAVLPQVQTSSRNVSFGALYGLAIPKVARNPAGSFAVARLLATADASKSIADALGLVSPRRDILAQKADGVQEIFRLSAIIARGFLDPDPKATERVFRNMIEDVTSGAVRLSDAVGRADKELTSLLGL